jgi:hypothetical protein
VSICLAFLLVSIRLLFILVFAAVSFYLV